MPVAGTQRFPNSAGWSMISPGSLLLPGEIGGWRVPYQAQAAALARQAAVFRRLASSAERLAAGDRAYQEGDVRAASVIYVRLAASKPATPSTQAAMQRLATLASEAREKLKDIDRTLSPEANLQPGQSPGEALHHPVSPETILEAFRKYEELADQYGSVPAVKHELPGHIARQRHHPKYAAVLNESEAKGLWELGQGHEKQDEQCCAYWVYQEAARLSPAPSAILAAQRFDQMQKDPQVVQAAKTCREIRLCHQVYHRATMMAKVKPDVAKELLSQVLNRAPEDSEVYRAALADFGATGAAR